MLVRVTYDERKFPTELAFLSVALTRYQVSLLRSDGPSSTVERRFGTVPIDVLLAAGNLMWP